MNPLTTSEVPSRSLPRDAAVGQIMRVTGVTTEEASGVLLASGGSVPIALRRIMERRSGDESLLPSGGS
jgi:hypothetical protein